MSESTKTKLSDVFEVLRELMQPYAAKLVCKTDGPGNLYVDTGHVMRNKKPLFFGAVQTKTRYVSYHLMPVYVRPELLDGMSGALKKRMQGKSCFNFNTVDKELFAELGRLTKSGYEFYAREGYV